MSRKKIGIIHTGGTFGMSLGKSPEALQKSPEFLNHLTKQVPELEKIAEIGLHILCNLDSSDANEELWTAIAHKIIHIWENYDGFVVIHGTDTMAWSATALAFILQSLTKPVVFTGSQRPLDALRNDARMNIIDAVEFASLGFPEVFICFDSQVHMATRVTKYSNEHLLAFKSFNASPVAHFGVNIKTKKYGLTLPFAQAKRHLPVLDARFDTKIMTFLPIPGVSMAESFLEIALEQFNGIVIKGFGAGNLPLNIPCWQHLCSKASAAKIPVIMLSQCQSGTVDLSAYENGKRFLELGVISGLNMTFEAATIKLMILLGRKVPYEKRQEFFATPLAHECSPGEKSIALSSC